MLPRYDIKITRRAMNRGRPFPATASRLSTFYPATPAPVATAPASPGAALQPPAGTMTDSVVLKKLAPGAAGARRLAARFGDALVCVRYREDAAGGQRLTTVELVVERRPLPPGEFLVRIEFEETGLRAQVKEAGGTWDPKLKLWHVPRAAVRKLKLTKRVIKKPA